MRGASFLQLEFRNNTYLGERYIVEQHAEIPFDTEIICSEDGLITSTNGVITFGQSGVFFVSWFVAQQTGLAPDGANFALTLVVDNILTEVIGSGHTKFSSLSGFAVINVPKAGCTLLLKNIASSRATLSKFTQVKAGIALFSLTPEQEVKRLGYNHRQTLSAIEYNTGETVKFGTSVKVDPYGIITYDEGIFTLGKISTYLITYELPIEATDEFDEVYVELVVDGLGNSIAYAPLPIGVVAGSAVVVTEEADIEIYLRVILEGELHTDIVRIANRGNIVITQIDSASV